MVNGDTNMKEQIANLVRSLDAAGLEELKRSVAAEVEGRRQETAFRLEHIHPKMSAEEKEQAAQEIARVLRGE
jgi:hypothetical protein